MYAERINKYNKTKTNYKINIQTKILKESYSLYKHPGKHKTYMHQVVYNNKLEHKYTLTPLDPKPLYVGPIRAKGHLSKAE